MGLYCLSQHLSLGLDLGFFSVCALSVGCSAFLSVRKIRAIAIKAPFFSLALSVFTPTVVAAVVETFYVIHLTKPLQ
jgi:hypothetical protein